MSLKPNWSRAALVALSVIVAVGDGRRGAQAQPKPTVEAPVPPALLRLAPTPLRIPRVLQRAGALAFSPDGKLLASGHGWYDREGSVQIWDVATGRRVGLEIFPIGVSSIGWTPDGKHIAASLWDSTMRIFAFPGLKPERRIDIDRSASRLGISPDGKQIMTAAEGYSPTDDSGGRVVQIWDAETGALVRKCDSEENLFRLSCAAWSPGGKFVAAGGGYYNRNPRGLARLWFAETGKEAARLEGLPGYVLGIRFFPDDDKVVTVGIDGTIRIWDTATGKSVMEMQAGVLMEGLDVARDGKWIATGTSTGAVSLWDPQAGTKIVDLNAAGTAVVSVAFSADGRTLASGSADGVIRLWNIDDRTQIHELPRLGSAERPGRAVTLAPAGDGEFVVMSGAEGALRAVQVTPERELWSRPGKAGQFPTAIAVMRDKNSVFAGHEDGALRLYAVGDGAIRQELQQMPARISAVACNVEMPLLAAGDAEGRVHVWDQGGKLLRAEQRDHQGAVLAVGFADKGRLITSIGADGTAVCRRTTGNGKVAEARVSDTGISSAVISADGTTALVLGQQLATWDAVRLTQRRVVNAALSPARALALSPDGSNVFASREIGTFFEGPQNGGMSVARVGESREPGVLAMSADNGRLFLGTDQGALRVWSVIPPRQSPLARIRRAGNAVSVTTSPDGKWLAAGGDDSQITIWDLETGRQVESLPAGGGTVYACQFSSDSRLLATATLGGTVKVWGVGEWTLEGSLLNPNRAVRCVGFSPGGRWLAMGRTDRTLVVTDTHTWDTVAEKPNQNLGVEGIAFSPDGKKLYSVTGSWAAADYPAAAMLSAWRIERGKEAGALNLELVKTVRAHERSSDNLVVTPDSRFVVTGSNEGQIKVWNASDLTEARAIRMPRPVHRIQLLPNAPSQIVVGDHAGGVSVWNIQTGAFVADYGGHVGHVFDATATVDGRLIISAGEDDSLLFWPGPSRGPDDRLTRFLKQATEPN